jgi:hypothetical protein
MREGRYRERRRRDLFRIGAIQCANAGAKLYGCGFAQFDGVPPL